MQLTIIHTIDPQVLEFISKLVPGSTLTGGQPKKTTPVPAPQTAVSKAAAPAEPSSAVPAAEVKKESVGLEQLRLLIGGLSADKRQACKELLKTFGADKLVDLKKEQYTNFHNQLVAL
jgi:hypothetical protein